MARPPDAYRVAAPNEAELADRADIDSFRATSLRARRRARAYVLVATLAGIGASATSLLAVARDRREHGAVVSRAPTSAEPLGPALHDCATATAQCHYDACYEAFDSDESLGAWYPVAPWRLSFRCEPLPGVPQIPDCDGFGVRDKAACLRVTRAHVAR